MINYGILTVLVLNFTKFVTFLPTNVPNVKFEQRNNDGKSSNC